MRWPATWPSRRCTPSAARSSPPGPASSASPIGPPSCPRTRRALLATVAADQGWDLDAFPLADLAAAVDRCRLNADQVARQADPLSELADAYEERLRRRNALDFASMVVLPLRLFRQDEHALRVLQDAFRWVIVDEYQDLDATQ